jgi:hypothetical protein
MNKNVLSVLSNFNSITYHAFIKNQLQMPPPINMFEPSSNDLALPNNQDTNEN